MQKSSVINLLKAFIAQEILQDKKTDLDDSTPLLGEGLLDSFSVMNLLVFIESELGVEIALETVPIERFQDLGTLAEFVIESGLPNGA